MKFVSWFFDADIERLCIIALVVALVESEGRKSATKQAQIENRRREFLESGTQRYSGQAFSRQKVWSTAR